MNLQEIDNIEFHGIDHKDYPDYTDARIISADYKGVPMTDEQLDEINENGEFVHEKLFEHLF